MDSGRNFDILGLKLSDCYFIYMGDDNKEFPVLKMLKSQRLFNALTFICRKPILNGHATCFSMDKLLAEMIGQNKEYLLIFADLKVPAYFFELIRICEKGCYADYRIAIIMANDQEYLYNNFSKRYAEFADSYHVMGLFLDEEKQSLQQRLGKVLNQLPLEYDNPTLLNLCDDLEWEFVRKPFFKEIKEKKFLS